jgi:hypothetical protein
MLEGILPARGGWCGGTRTVKGTEPVSTRLRIAKAISAKPRERERYSSKAGVLLDREGWETNGWTNGLIGGLRERG